MRPEDQLQFLVLLLAFMLTVIMFFLMVSALVHTPMETLVVTLCIGLSAYAYWQNLHGE